MATKIIADWTALAEEVPVPGELLPALMANRVELLTLAQRPMNTEEVGKVLNILRVLMNTNQALQQRCSVLYEELENLRGSIKGLLTSVNHMQAQLSGQDESEDGEGE
jgi:hypothetical protein